jgi:hypothetical protein
MGTINKIAWSSLPLAHLVAEEQQRIDAEQAAKQREKDNQRGKDIERLKREFDDEKLRG